MNGLDPEFFIMDGSNHVVPASKVFPEATGVVAHDNAAIEIRPTAQSCLETLNGVTSSRVGEAFTAFRKARYQGTIPRSSEISFIPAGRLHESDRSLPSVQAFGCSPALRLGSDFTFQEVRPNVDGAMTPWRSAGYHVHYSGGADDSLHAERDAAIALFYTPRIHLIDCLVGLADVMMVAQAGWEKQSRIRREHLGYGRAGEFRLTPHYGRWKHFEYRSPSPWALSHPVWTWWMGSAVRQIIQRFYPEGGIGTLLSKLPDRSEVIQVMDECDGPAAMELWWRAYRAVGYPMWDAVSGTNALSKDNMAFFFHALRNGGHTYPHRVTRQDPRRAWMINIRDESESPWWMSRQRNRAQWRRSYAPNPDIPLPTYLYQGLRRPTGDQAFYFPSGMRKMIRSKRTTLTSTITSFEETLNA